MKTERQKRILVLRRQLKRNQAWVEQFRQRNGWAVIPGDKTPPRGASMTNEERSELEVLEWHEAPPERYFLYCNVPDRTVTTWTGTVLGRLYLGREWRSNMGDTRVPCWVEGSNGVRYCGTYFKSRGDYARIQRLKTKT